MIISEEDFLEHYGVKGMKWGIRRAKTKQALYEAKLDAENAKTRYLTETKESRAASRKRNVKIAAGAGVVAAVAVGSVMVPRMVQANKTKKLAQISKKNAENRRGYERLLQAKRGIQVDAINKAFREGKITNEQGWRLGALMDKQLVSKLNKKYP